MEIKIRQRKDGYFEIYCKDSGIIYDENTCTSQYWQAWLSTWMDIPLRSYTKNLIKKYNGIPVEYDRKGNVMDECPPTVILFRSPKDAQKAIEEYITPRFMAAKMRWGV